LKVLGKLMLFGIAQRGVLSWKILEVE